MSKDFESFINAKSHTTSQKLDDSVISYVNDALETSISSVFLKLIGIHGVIGLLTLLFCPQFKLSLTNNYDLYHYFHMNYGEHICMLICGFIFMGSGVIVARAVLKQAELTLIKENQFLCYLALSGIACTSFLLFGAEIYLNLLIFWFLGSLISSLQLQIPKLHFR